MKFATGLIALLVCLAVAEARYRYKARPARYSGARPSARGALFLRYAPRQRQVAEGGILAEPGVPVFPDGTPAVEEVPFADFPAPNPVVPEPDARDDFPDTPYEDETKVLAVPLLPVPSADAGSRTPQALPQGGSYFPVSFGGVRSATVALANSLSTGNKGKADSRSVAFGQPEEEVKRARYRYRY